MPPIAVPRLTAEVLLAHAMRRERVYLFAHPEQELREVEWLHYGRYLHERIQGKPTQYITKRQEFYGREFRVTPDVLIPRAGDRTRGGSGARRVARTGAGAPPRARCRHWIRRARRNAALETGAAALRHRYLARRGCGRRAQRRNASAPASTSWSAI